MKAKFICRDIDHLKLDEVEAEILRKAVAEIRKKRSDKFDESLNRASEIVASWPQWKQDLARQVLAPSKRPTQSETWDDID